jgi:hypothetical protein
MARTLDRSRPYGEVMGHQSVRYEQDGAQFNAEGDLVGDAPTVSRKAAKADKPVTTEPEDQVAAQLGGSV